MNKPKLKNMTRERLIEWHQFCLEQSIDYSEGTTRNGRMAWRRERTRVDNEIINRDHPKQSNR